jgi:hypothetical protein
MIHFPTPRLSRRASVPLRARLDELHVAFAGGLDLIHGSVGPFDHVVDAG